MVLVVLSGAGWGDTGLRQEPYKARGRKGEGKHLIDGRPRRETWNGADIMEIF